MITLRIICKEGRSLQLSSDKSALNCITVEATEHGLLRCNWISELQYMLINVSIACAFETSMEKLHDMTISAGGKRLIRPAVHRTVIPVP